MGHAHHFLSRLDRLARSHVELALSLYRDDERLRFLLQQARVPEGAERIAVSLDDPHQGPFVLVTRTGHFVTCLGPGMRVDDLPIITRAELDALSQKHGLWRGREEAKKQLLVPGGGAAFLMGRLLDAGPFLAREEFQALAALHPLLGEEYIETATEWVLAARRLQLVLKPALKKRGLRLRPLQLEQLEVLWKSFFAAGHLAVLSLVDEGETIARVTGTDEKAYERKVDVLIEIVTQGGILSKTARGVWMFAQLGKRWLPHAKRRLAQATTGLDVMRATFTMIALAARHPELCAEVREAFDPAPQLATEEAHSWARYLCEVGLSILDRPDEMQASHQKLGTTLAFELRELYPTTSPYHYARPEDVPADIAFGHPFQLVVNFVQDIKMFPHIFSMLLPAARAAPEQLYLPRRCVEFIDQWEPEQTLVLMESVLAPKQQPASRPSEPTRNGPCPCGSGKKYKRCCLDAESH